MAKRLFTSESVTEGHPDKIADQISDAVLDAIYAQDPQARVACETALTTGLVLVMGEITTNCYVDINKTVRDTINEIGYDNPDYGFDGHACGVIVALDEQSPDIAMGVNKALEAKRGEMTESEAGAGVGDGIGFGDGIEAIGAGDQGMMFGFACDETPELMPMPISLAHRLAKRLSEVRKNGTLSYLRPDGKTQVTVIYEDGCPVGIDTILISTQHTAVIGELTDSDEIQHKIKADLWEAVVEPVFEDINVKPDAQTRFLVNPTGKFVIGGPQGDSGLTGRKIIVDTYGGYSRHGGGAFSGKDPTKVDRTAAYACRYIAKNIVAAGLAEKCEVQVSYAIGVARPVSIHIDTFGSGKVDEDQLLEVVKQQFELRPAGMIQAFNLQHLPAKRGGHFFQHVAAYGHFGRTDLGLPWEKTDKVELLKQALLQPLSVAQ